MLENPTKGWHGCFSLAGRNSCEKFHLIVHKDEILSNEKKKIKIKDIFTPDDDMLIENTDLDKMDVFKAYASAKQDKYNTVNEGNKLQKDEDLEQKFRYHNTHMRQIEKEKEERNKIPLYKRQLQKDENESLYYPKYDFIWMKTPTSSYWSKPKYGKEKPKEIDNKTFFLEKVPDISKCLVNMGKQTKRGKFIDNIDLRIRNDKPYKPNETEESEKNSDWDSMSKTSKITKMTLSKRTRNKTDITAFSPNKSKNKKHIKSKTNPSFYNTYIKAPDFSKTISREDVEKIKGIKHANPDARMPNYSLVRERPLTMAVLDKPIKKKKKYEHVGVDPSLFYDPDKMINKINNHVAVVPPNFKLMTSRPNDNKTLPTYVQKMYTRQSPYCVTDLTLKLNNFSNANFKHASSSFCQKKSFNNLVNLNLLKSDTYNGKYEKFLIKNDKKVFTDPQVELEKRRLEKSAATITKNYEDVEKEGVLHRFDNITFKTTKQKQNLDAKDMEKFLLNFDYASA
ncbi:MAG: hypothetical protein MJ252_02335 [archaeon]|nr:hypothetical protein [archaeon]